MSWQEIIIQDVGRAGVYVALIIATFAGAWEIFKRVQLSRKKLAKKEDLVKVEDQMSSFVTKEDFLRLEDEIDTIRKDIHIKIDEIKKSNDGLSDSIKELTNRYHEIDKNLAVVAKK